MFATRWRLVVIILSVILLFTSLLSLSIGKYPLGLNELWISLISGGQSDTNADVVLWHYDYHVYSQQSWWVRLWLLQVRPIMMFRNPWSLQIF